MRLLIRCFFYLSLLLFICFSLATEVFLPRYFEDLLQRLFGMPIRIESIQVNPFSGRGTASRVEFVNPEGFSRAPHFLAERLHFQIHWTRLFKKSVDMDYVYLEDLYFLIEKRIKGETRRSNLMHWVRHIKEWKAQRRRNSKSSGPTKWTVSIKRIEIHNGVFVYDSRRDFDTLQQYRFDRIYGVLTDFKWPSADYAAMNQTLRLTARIGEEYPAPLEIHGRADFATKHVSFDLEGMIPDGDVREFERFWSHLPVRVESGSFRLNTRFLCVDKNLETQNVLEIRNLDVRTHGNPIDRLWGVSWVTMIKFLESKELVTLDVPVTGMVNNPNFEYSRAFSDAVKKNMSQYVNSGLKVFVEAPAQIAAQTKELVSLSVDVGKKIVQNAVKAEQEL